MRLHALFFKRLQKLFFILVSYKYELNRIQINKFVRLQTIRQSLNFSKSIWIVKINVIIIKNYFHLETEKNSDPNG